MSLIHTLYDAYAPARAADPAALPSEVYSCSPTLPPELMHLILSQVAYETRDPSRRWYMAHSAYYPACWSLLHTLSQVNRTLRGALMPFIWSHVTCREEKYEGFVGLSRLIHELSVRGPLPSVGDCIQTLSLEVTGQDWQRGMTSSDVRTINRRCGLPASDADDPEWRITLMLREMCRRLTACRQLRMFTWQGSIQADPWMLRYLSHCPALTCIHLDVKFSQRGERLLDDRSGAVKLFEDADALPKTAATRRRAFVIDHLALTVKPRDTTRRLYAEAAYLYEGIPDPQRGLDAVQVATRMRLARTMTLAAPRLLYEAWMVPLWAQLEMLHFDFSCYDSQPHFMRHSQGEDEGMLRAAQAFPWILDSDERLQESLQGKEPEMAPVRRAVLDVIRRHRLLRPWKFWFNDQAFAASNSRRESRQRIVHMIAEVLVDRRRYTRVKRERWMVPWQGW